MVTFICFALLQVTMATTDKVNQNFHSSYKNWTYDRVLDYHLTCAPEKGIITEDDRVLIKNFIEAKLAKEQIQDGRAVRIASQLCNWRRFIPEYRSATSETIITAIGKQKKGLSDKGQPYTDNTRGEMIRTLITFSRWLAKKQISIIDLDEIGEIEPPDKTFTSVNSKDILDDSKINRLIDYCYTPRDKALLALLAETGARTEELAMIKWADLDFSNAKTVRVKLIDAKDKSISKMAYVVLRRSYLIDLRKSQSGDSEDDYVFRQFHRGTATITSQQITYAAVSYLIKGACARAGVTLPRGAVGKLFRASSVTNKLKNGVAPVAIMKSTWSSGLNSRMFKHYEKMNDIDTESMMLAGAGVSVEIMKPEATEDNTMIRCTCGLECAPKSKFCPECGEGLNKAAMAKQNDMKKSIAENMSDPEFKKALLEYLKKQ